MYGLTYDVKDMTAWRVISMKNKFSVLRKHNANSENISNSNQISLDNCMNF